MRNEDAILAVEDLATAAVSEGVLFCELNF